MPGPMTITRLHHSAVCVTDIERSKRFYAEVLGLQEVARPDFDFEGAWYEFADGSQLHLIVHDTPLALRGTRSIDTRDGHLALRVDSYEATLGRLTALGVEHQAYRDNKTPWAQIYLTDPDGNVVELNAERR